MKTIVKGIEYINNGVSIVIFPEGTTSKDGTLLPFHDGSLKFAEKSGCKIVPMVQNNTRFLWENQKPKIRKTRTVLEFCEPIDVKALSKEEKRHLGGYVKQIIEEVYARNEELV
jgi:1-acyl-sn-glycerol-3-phosphate acyltransferase